MKTIFASCISIAALLCSCGGNSQKQSADAAEDSVQTVADLNIDGQWNIDNVVVNDTLSVRPAEETPDAGSRITFDNGSYSIMTNCNSIQGSYTLKGDSIALEAGLCTEMACDNMRAEDLLKQVLPEIRTASLENDSTLRLNGETSSYVLLSRMKEPVK